MSDSAKTYTIRVQSDYAYRYSLGEAVVPGVVLFSSGFVNLTRAQLDAKLKSLGKVTLR